jgi:NADH dehydrogenase [ubiquinone] 1 alpha subcomplex assembly factor 1
MAHSTGSPRERPSGRSSRLAERLVDFAGSDATMDWHPIDDVVMGGVSQSALQPYARGFACFGGVVSLERGGGFASVRTEPRKWNTAGAQAFVLRCRGDGRQYKFTVRTDDGFDGVQYQARFAPPRGEWTTVVIPVTEFAASFRGRLVPGAQPLDPAHIRQLGLMISDKQAGPFELLLEWIDAAC